MADMGRRPPKLRQRRLRSAIRLNPFGSLVDKTLPDQRVLRAITIVGAYREHLQDDRIPWFGWPLKDDVQERYVAVGFLADEELELAESRGYVADVVSGHLIWERGITNERDLPRRVADLVRR
jgi:hypothetical protein